jgi:[glutamine synthetase] adenylyltransferase / [glutamine synthetase]-adenylyl-L-tyrosine phosphorylase
MSGAPQASPTQSLLPLSRQISTAPQLTDAKGAERRLADFLGKPGHEEIARLAADKNIRELLQGIADHSVYLWRLAATDHRRLARLLNEAPEASLRACLTGLESACASIDSEQDLMARLRLAKQEIALLVALADLGGAWDLVAVMDALSDAADLFVSLALRFMLRGMSANGKLHLTDPAAPEAECGLVVVALGKLGARELNYSSDIDLMVLFDPASAAVPDGTDPGPLFVRLTKNLVRLLQDRTGDGYVARVDLRLRPDPGSTAIAVALPAALFYYEMYGQNWERAALIKARPIAGDLALGRRFLQELTPFIWRKYFDYAAIADIHAMKRQTHAMRGHAEIAVAGHDIKLGRGGIREIEFFVQTQQLIFGGKRPDLRGARTLDMLQRLFEEGWITREAADELKAAYIALRGIEHRLQMIADEQTHRLPLEKDKLKKFARFCGFARVDQFSRALTRHFRDVVFHYALLFEHAPDLSAELGSLVFTGVSDDPETLETLARLGFKNPSLAVETVRGWHFGRRAAVQTARAREVLTELLPSLIQSFAQSGAPDAALAAFDQALAHMPAAIELFLILKSNPNLQALFSDILGSAPRLAAIIEQRPHVLDATLDTRRLDIPLDEKSFEERAAFALRSAAHMEAFLDAARDFAQEEMFLISLRLLAGLIDAQTAGRAFSALAAAVVQASLRQVEHQIAADHGHVPGGRCVVVALGKLGSREMTATSDLDLMLIYDFDAERPVSDGVRPLHAGQYYARLAQRLVSALTVPTRRGRLYEVDMRLRPSGGKGPVAVQMSGFLGYQMHEAETWEHMALTRARVIAGDKALAAEVQSAIRAIICSPRGESLRRDVLAMRNLIAREKVATGPWNLKLTAGGLLDIEFLAQYLLLRHAHDEPNFYAISTAELIDQAAGFGFLTFETARDLLQAHSLYTNVTQILGVTLAGDTPPPAASLAVKRRLAGAADLPDFAHLVRELEETRAQTRRIFTRLLTTDWARP